MQIEEYLKKFQPVIYQTFKNSLLNNHLVHAYLLVGNTGVPTLNIAKFLASSLVCDNPTPLACQHCLTCQRIKENNYPDLVIYDGALSTIKKDDVTQLEVNFENTSLEKKNKKIYILNLVENMTVQAINAILKFLEEPQKNVYAFLTTNNESLILPTIISRCQVMHLKLIPRDIVISLSKEAGVDSFDAELLSYIFNDVDTLISHAKSDSDYQVAKECLNLFIDSVLSSKNDMIYVGNKNILAFINNKQSGRYFFDLLCAVFLDIQSIFYQKKPYLQEIEDKLQEICKKINNINDVCLELLKTRESLSLNVNTSLILDHIINVIYNNMEGE